MRVRVREAGEGKGVKGRAKEEHGGTNKVKVSNRDRKGEELNSKRKKRKRDRKKE